MINSQEIQLKGAGLSFQTEGSNTGSCSYIKEPVLSSTVELQFMQAAMSMGAWGVRTLGYFNNIYIM